jgi:hypothetical protein
LEPTPPPEDADRPINEVSRLRASVFLCASIAPAPTPR